ncbi:MAG: outer membrane lipoprotein carrier protein LolA [Flavobacteriales bacterium]
MKKSIFLCILLIISLLSTAQNQQNSVKKILDKTYENIKKYKGLAFRFTYQWNYPKGDIQGTEEGTLYVSGKKYRLTLIDIIQICDGSNIYTISPKNKEVTISNIKSGENLLSLIQILATYDENYTLTKDTLKKIDKKNIRFTRLDPKDKKSTEYLLVGINTTDHTLYQVIKIGKDNNTTTITIRKQIPWTKVESSLLKFNPKDYPDHMITTLN